LAEVDLKGGPPQPDRPGGGAGHSPWHQMGQLPECSSTAYEDQSKPQVKVLTVNSCIKVRLDLQADKSPVVVKGPFFPRVVNPRYRIRETNV
jgi:hypothetical protein